MPRKARALSALALTAAAAAASLVSLGGGATTAPAEAASLPPCGTSPSTTFTTCVFHDDFSGGLLGNSLDGNKWVKSDSKLSGMSEGGTNCVQPANVAVGGGMLKVTSKKLASAITCTNYDGSKVSTRLVGGGITSYGKYNHTYGRVEFRAAFPNAPQNKLIHSALWMAPQNNTYNPGGIKWPYNGEIDVAERMPFYNEPISMSLHYADKSGATTYSNGDKNPGESVVCPNTTPTEFHTYAAEWTPTNVTFLIDNVTCTTLAWDPANLTAPAPFDQPFHESISQAVADDGTLPVSSYTMQVDWVKVWQ